MSTGLRRTVSGLIGLLLLCAVYELYKAVGPQDGGSVLGTRILPRADDTSLPHLWQILSTLGDPEVRTPGSRSVGTAVLASAWFTGKVTLGGFALGSVAGLLVAVLMQRARVLEQALLPYVVLSQTVPLVALAPLIAGWGGRLHVGSVEWRPWMSVVVVSAYLAFCPVAVGALRGLQSPGAAPVELMRSYAASWWQALVRLRLPAALPFLLPALRLAAAAAVVGAIVAEISTGARGGIGRLILEYSQQATSEPARVYDAVLGAALLGLLLSGLVALADTVLLRRHTRPVTR